MNNYGAILEVKVQCIPVNCIRVVLPWKAWQAFWLNSKNSFFNTHHFSLLWLVFRVCERCSGPLPGCCREIDCDCTALEALNKPFHCSLWPSLHTVARQSFTIDFPSVWNTWTDAKRRPGLSHLSGLMPWIYLKLMSILLTWWRRTKKGLWKGYNKLNNTYL